MSNLKFIQIHANNQAKVISEYIRGYEEMEMLQDANSINSRYNWLTNILMSAPYLTTVVRLIQAESNGIRGNEAWSYLMDWRPSAVYKSLKSINH